MAISVAGRMPGPVSSGTVVSMTRPVSAVSVDPPDHSWVRTPATARERRIDVIAAAALLVGAILSTMLYRLSGLFADDAAPPWAGLVWALAITAPLAWRRRFPGAVALAVAAAFMIGGILQVPELLINNIALFLALYSVGAWEPSRRRASIIRIAVIAAMFIWLMIAMFRSATDPDAMADVPQIGALSPLAAYMLIQILTNLLYFGAAYYFGDKAYAGAHQRHLLEQRTRQLEHEQARNAAQAVTVERLRIARELHDVVAHHVSMMGIQAGAARTVLSTDPGAARDALANVELNARSAIDEMHQLLGTLREPTPEESEGLDVEDAATMASTRGLGSLPELVRESIAAGLPVRQEIIGEPRPVPAVVALTLYRVAQEALTNARKHAGLGATADLRLRYRDDVVELEISNTGTVPSRASRTGLGQRGIRERVAAIGGEVELRPRSRGGYLVRVQVPVAAGPPINTELPAWDPAATDSPVSADQGRSS